MVSKREKQTAAILIASMELLGTLRLLCARLAEHDSGVNVAVRDAAQNLADQSTPVIANISAIVDSEQYTMRDLDRG